MTEKPEKVVNPELAEVTDDIRKAIIEQYYKQPVLWDRNHEKADRSSMPAAWEFIASAVSTRSKTFSVKIVKTVMKNLKDQFVRVHRKATQEGGTVQWKFYEDLLFLADSLPSAKQPLQSTENVNIAQEMPRTNGILSNFVSSISSAFTRQPPNPSDYIKEEYEGNLVVDETNQAPASTDSPTNMLYNAAQNRIQCKEELLNLSNPPNQVQYQNTPVYSTIANAVPHQVQHPVPLNTANTRSQPVFSEIPGVFTQSTPIKDTPQTALIKPEFSPIPHNSSFANLVPPTAQTNSAQNVPDSPKSEQSSQPILPPSEVHHPGPLYECISQAISPQCFADTLNDVYIASLNSQKRLQNEGHNLMESTKKPRIEVNSVNLAPNQPVSAPLPQLVAPPSPTAPLKSVTKEAQVSVPPASVHTKPVEVPISKIAETPDKPPPKNSKSAEAPNKPPPKNSKVAETPNKPLPKKPSTAVKSSQPLVLTNITPQETCRKPQAHNKTDVDRRIILSMQDQCLKTMEMVQSQSALGLMVAEIARKLESERKDKTLEFKRAVLQLIDNYEQLLYH
ncbi:unnamed protein product [Bursaphelenchus xylophilus]|nr:unnamed protein product [Bursaphelenchus xylophilus]CAG9125021.1 unnamed protein product [Bursaphelenchus xylophilus]